MDAARTTAYRCPQWGNACFLHRNASEMSLKKNALFHPSFSTKSIHLHSRIERSKKPFKCSHYRFNCITLSSTVLLPEFQSLNILIFHQAQFGGTKVPYPTSVNSCLRWEEGGERVQGVVVEGAGWWEGDAGRFSKCQTKHQTTFACNNFMEPQLPLPDYVATQFTFVGNDQSQKLSRHSFQVCQKSSLMYLL